MFRRRALRGGPSLQGLPIDDAVDSVATDALLWARRHMAWISVRLAMAGCSVSSRVAHDFRRSVPV
jgi:hypothetical protein